MSDERGGREYPGRPMAGVGAVIWDGQRVLLERRGQPPSQDKWAIPGGVIELGETAEEAVHREVREETGLEIELGPILGLFQPIERGPDGRVRYHFVVIDFLAYYVSGTLAAADDAAEVRWVTPDEMPQYDLAPAVREMVGRALAVLRRG